MPSSHPELIYEFPEDFLWGVSSPLIPFDNQTDWAHWVHLGRARQPLLPPHPFHKDALDPLKQLGIQLYRHTASWSQIEPERGKFDLSALAQLTTHLAELKAAGIQIMLTLHSYVHPAWFHRETPWHTTQSIAVFARYAEKLFEALSGVVDYWITFNDPNIFWVGGYGDAVIPPGYADATLASLAFRNLLEAHSTVYHAIKSSYGPSTSARQVGMSLHQTHFAPARRWHIRDHQAARHAHQLHNELFLDALLTGKAHLVLPHYTQTLDCAFAKGSLDFIGVNYYTRTQVQHTPAQNLRLAFKAKPTEHPTDMGWESYPKGLLQVLRTLSAYSLPLFITENGCADAQDQHRSQFIFDHLSQVRQALKEDLPIKGYCYHAWIDGMEGLEGDQPKYGLCSIHPQTHTAHLRDSGRYYAGIARSHRMFIKGVI